MTGFRYPKILLAFAFCLFVFLTVHNNFRVRAYQATPTPGPTASPKPTLSITTNAVTDTRAQNFIAGLRNAI